jgi:hypothetical protein
VSFSSVKVKPMEPPDRDSQQRCSSRIIAAPVAAAWRACAGNDADTDAQAVWTRLAGRPLPVDETDARLKFTDREIVRAQRVLDIIAIDLAAKLRNRVPPLAWARLVAREEGPNRPGLLKDPSRNVPKLMAWAKQGWGGGDRRSHGGTRACRAVVAAAGHHSLGVRLSLPMETVA